MPEVNKKLQKSAEELRSKGRGGDSILAHINPQEAELLKAHGGSGTINPKTGLPEFLVVTNEDGTKENWGGAVPEKYLTAEDKARLAAREASRKGGLGGVFSDLVQGTATIAPVWLAVGVPIAGAAVGQALLGGVVSTSVATAVGTGIVSGAVTAAYGGKPDDILKSAVVGGVTAGVGAQVASSVGNTIAKAAADAGYASVAQTVGSVVGSAAGSATAAGTSAAIKGKNPIDALVNAGLSGLVTGGVGATVSTYTADIPGFSNLSKDYGATGAAVQRAVNTGLAAGAMGKDVDKSVLNSVIGSVTSTTKDFLKNGIKDSSDTLTAKYKDYTSTADAIDKNIADQDAAVNGYQKVITDTGVTTKYEAAQAALKEYETAKNAFDTGGKTQALADVANAKVAVANDLIKAYNAAYDIAAPQLKTYETTLNELKTAQPKLETTFLDQKKTLDTSIVDFTKQEKANADFISDTVNKTLAAKDFAKEALGADLTEEQVATFIKTGDVTTAVKDYVASNTTTRDEAATALKKAGYDATEDEITTFIGRTADNALQAKIDQYVDPRQVTTDEARTAFQDTYGYTPSNEELAQFTGKRDEASTYTDIGKYVDPRQVTNAEARASFVDTYGYTPTDAELAQFTGQRDQTGTYADIGKYVDPRQVTTAEAKAAFQDTYGYTPTDAELAQFTGQRDQAATVKDIGMYVNPRQVTANEARTEFENTYGYTPTDAEVNQFIGQKDQTSTFSDIASYVDPRQVTNAEAKSQFQDTFGYTPTDAELAQFTGQRDQASTYTDIGAYVDPRQVTTAEATTQFKDIYGYTPNNDELAQFTGQRDQASTYTDIGAYVDPRQVTADEFSSAATGENFSYDPADYDFLGQYTGQRDEAATLDAFRQYADPLATTNQEAIDFYKQSYADLYGVDPASVSDADAAQFMAKTGNTAEGAYTSGAKDRFSQDLGFDDYTDVTEARQVLGEARPDIASWQDYGETGGVVDTGDGTSVGVKSGQPINMFDTGEADQTTADAGLSPEDLGLPPSTPTRDYAATQPEAPPMSMEDLFANAYRGDSDVQTAGLTPSASMTDTGAPTDMGVRSLLTQQEGGTSADSAKTQGLGTLTEKYLTPTSDQQTQQKDEGTDVAESTLTSGAPAGTITRKVLGDNADQDVPVGTIAGKYFNEPKQGTEGADSAVGKSPTSDFLYSTPRTPGETTDKLGTTPTPDQFGSLLARIDPTTLTTSQDTPQTNAATKGNKMDFDPNLDSDPEASGTNLDRFTLPPAEGLNEDFLSRLSPSEQARYLASQQSDYRNPLENLPGQDLGISDGMLEEFNRNYNPAGGYGSQWQTVGTDRIMVNDDGTGIGINENGEQYALTPEQVQSMIRNKLLNTKGSGYVDATGGTGDVPGGTDKGKGKGTDKSGKLVDKIIDYATSPRGLATIAGAVAGPAIAPKGITPMGLRGIQTGSNQQLTQTGAKGTGGRGGVRYFEKKAGGGTVGGLGYLKTAHDGMADQIDATIDNKRPAKLSGGEFVIPADVVSHLGNGNSEAGAKQLYELMARIRKERTGTPKQAKQVNPKKYLPQ